MGRSPQAGGAGHRQPAGTSVPGIDAGAVTAWLSQHAPDVRPPLRFARITGGRSNLTFRVVDTDGRLLVLRRPPLHGVLRGAHDMAREYRIIAALGPTVVPVPGIVGLCQDESVTGAPFYVMDFVEGLVLRDGGEAARLAEAARHRAACSLLDTLVQLQGQDPEGIGLGDLGRKEDYIARQLRTWGRQWQQSRTRDLPAVEEAHRRLSARIPAQQRASVVHGDYRLDNVIVTPTGEVAAVVDWELCTLGDPLADLGLLLVYWGEPGDAFTALPDAPSTLPGFPPRSELVSRYGAACGLDLEDLDYYLAFGYWKIAVVLEGVYARSRAGAYGEGGRSFDGLVERVDLLAEAALEAARRAGR